VGQALTQGPCNICWGSGDEKHPWLNLLLIDELSVAQEALTRAEVAALDWVHENMHTPKDEDFYHNYNLKAEEVFSAEREVLAIVTKLTGR